MLWYDWLFLPMFDPYYYIRFLPFCQDPIPAHKLLGRAVLSVVKVLVIHLAKQLQKVEVVAAKQLEELLTPIALKKV